MEKTVPGKTDFQKVPEAEEGVIRNRFAKFQDASPGGFPHISALSVLLAIVLLPSRDICSFVHPASLSFSAPSLHPHALPRLCSLRAPVAFPLSLHPGFRAFQFPGSPPGEAPRVLPCPFPALSRLPARIEHHSRPHNRPFRPRSPLHPYLPTPRIRAFLPVCSPLSPALPSPPASIPLSPSPGISPSDAQERPKFARSPFQAGKCALRVLSRVFGTVSAFLRIGAFLLRPVFPGAYTSHGSTGRP